MNRERLVSLDVFRGLTIAGMLIVNDPGSWSNIYPPLEHAEWHGWTPTDLVFPFFLFIVGITTHLSIAVRRSRGESDSAIMKQIIRRGAIIFLLGFLMSLFPFYQWTLGDVTFWEKVQARWENVRILGVLQRIGIVYTAAALLSLKTTLKQQIVIVTVLLYGYWAAMTLLPVPGEGTIGALLLDDKTRNLAAHVDRLILTEKHTWPGSVKYDPEGILSTLPAIGTAMLGIFAGRWIGTQRPLSDRISALFAAGSLTMVVGLMWNWVFPINKNLWTSSYVLFTAGMAAVTLATCMWLIDDKRVTWWTKPFVVFGVNPILAFVGSGLTARLIYSVIKVQYNGEVVPLQTAIYKSVFEPFFDPRLSSMLFALVFTTLWLGILWILYRKRIFLKV